MADRYSRRAVRHGREPRLKLCEPFPGRKGPAMVRIPRTGTLPVGQTGMGGHDEDTGARIIPRHFRGELDPVEAGQCHLGQNQIEGRALGQGGAAVTAVFRDGYVMAGAGEGVMHDRAVRRIVLDKKDANHHAFRAMTPSQN